MVVLCSWSMQGNGSAADIHVGLRMIVISVWLRNTDL